MAVLILDILSLIPQNVVLLLIRHVVHLGLPQVDGVVPLRFSFAARYRAVCSRIHHNCHSGQWRGPDSDLVVSDGVAGTLVYGQIGATSYHHHDHNDKGRHKRCHDSHNDQSGWLNTNFSLQLLLHAIHLQRCNRLHEPT